MEELSTPLECRQAGEASSAWGETPYGCERLVEALDASSVATLPRSGRLSRVKAG